jgi:hypothetical protein
LCFVNEKNYGLVGYILFAEPGLEFSLMVLHRLARRQTDGARNCLDKSVFRLKVWGGYENADHVLHRVEFGVCIPNYATFAHADVTKYDCKALSIIDTISDLIKGTF